MERRFRATDRDLAVAGLPATLHIALPADPDAPLDALATRERAGALAMDTGAPADAAAAIARAAVARGTHLPYWALLWPSGQALASLIARQPTALAGRRVLELGCGLGVTACAALLGDSQLWVADTFADALLFCRYNALRNVGRAPRTLLLDWRSAAGQRACRAVAPFDLLLAADVLYEAEDEPALLGLAPTLLRPGGVFWLAEPGRRVARRFVEQAHARGWRDDPQVCERAWPPDGERVRVTVHRFSGLAANT